jgi:osmoprotectant transport system substrate-binding protein
MKPDRRGRGCGIFEARRTALLCLILIALLSSCAPSHSDRIVVGSKNFTESLILGELLAQQIEAHSQLKVERRFYLAGTYICQQALLAGRIDIYPEYTGTALTAILKQQVGGNKAEVYRRVKSEYEARLGLTLGPPFGFNDTFAMEIRGEDARRLNLKTLSQAAALAPQWRAGFGYEFMERPDGYAGLAAAYGLHFAAPPRIMDLGLLAPALRDQAVAVVRQQTEQQHPEVAQAIAELGGKISDQEMRQLNYALDGQHRDVKDVAHEFLRGKGLIP